MPQHRLYGLRGKAYVAKFKQIYEEDGEAITISALKKIEEKKRFTLPMLGELCNEFLLPVTVMDDFLTGLLSKEKGKPFFYPSGTWDRARDRGCKAKDIGVVWDESPGDRQNIK